MTSLTRAVALLVFLSVAAAGCGGGGHGAAIANLGTTTTGASDSGTADAPTSSADRLAAGRRYSACMRRNGVPQFPDPSADGGLVIQSGHGVDPGSPAFRAAQAKCGKLLPHGGKPMSPAQQAKAQAQMLRYSACMRSHGVPKFPDPQFSNGRAKLSINGGIDPNSPQFKAAQRACASVLPGLKGGGHFNANGGGKKGSSFGIQVGP
jgi:hypothetical protein